MMDDSAPIHERRKLVKTYKMCSLENGLWLLRYDFDFDFDFDVSVKGSVSMSLYILLVYDD